MLRFLLVLILAVSAGGAAANVVSDMRTVGDAKRTRFVVDLAKNPDYGILRLANPYRLVIDLPGVEFAEPARPGTGRGLVSDYRYGLIGAGKARIVLDLAAPAEIVSEFVLDPMDGDPARLVIDLIPTTEAAFEAAALQDRPRAATPARAAPGAPFRSGGRPVVVIDPGHGGIDAGATGVDGLQEKEVTLKFALELASRLRRSGKLEPMLTRDGDDFVSLRERIEVARHRRAALFISIHADSVAEDYVRGATVYTLSEDASDAVAETLAARENRSDVLAGLSIEDEPDEVADILIDFARRETRNISIRFAKALVGDMQGTLALNGHPLRRASFLVLKAPDVPSVLLELGYLSNAEDGKLFRGASWPKAEAASVAKAVEGFFVGSLTAGQ